jgi:long-chain acyl-CoA synthetase
MSQPTSITQDQVCEILKHLSSRISEVVKPWVEKSPDQPALAETSGTWTYRQLSSVVAETQAWLIQSGVRSGDRVMIVCENCRAFVAVLLAAAGMDAWPVLVNAHLSAREIDLIRDHCGARRVIYTTSVSPHATEHAKRHGAVMCSLLQPCLPEYAH